MFDTVSIVACFNHTPDIDLMVENGCKPFLDKYGEAYKLVLNGEIGAKEPRLTITRTWKGIWRLQIEVSIGAWLFNSNLFLPNEKDIANFLEDLSLFIYYKTGLHLYLEMDRMNALDVTRDFKIGESNVFSFIKAISQVIIPRYNRNIINDTSVYFVNAGAKPNKVFKIYSKMHELIKHGATNEEIELARGYIRLEVNHNDGRAVSNLAKSLKVENQCRYLLTKQTSETVIRKAMKLLNFDEVLYSNDDSKLQTLAEHYDKAMPLTLAGHLLYKAQYGANYHELPFINLKAQTIKSYERDCAKTGTLSL